ncbi:MAG TPA: FkbM family methyltransferase [Tepidisphaeraceae bacterium]
MGRMSTFLNKRINAWRLGIPLTISSRFQLPKHMRIAGHPHRLNLPDEIGVRVAMMEVLIGDCYGIRKIPAPVRTILDVGANVGIFCLAAREAHNEATIHAYEPNGSLEPYLSNQAGVANASYFMKAISATEGRVSVQVGVDSVCTTTHMDDHGSIPAVGIRQAIDALGGHVDFVKMDCEGAEWEILDDVEAWSHVQHLALEYHLTPAHGANLLHQDIRRSIGRIGLEISKQEESPTFGLLWAHRKP